jgi:hypothetical protein
MRIFAFIRRKIGGFSGGHELISVSLKIKSIYYRKKIADKSMLYGSRIVGRSLFYRGMIADKSLSYRNTIMDKSLFCRGLIADKSLHCRDLVVTTSLSCKDRLLGAIFEALHDIPVKYKNGEFVVNEREAPDAIRDTGEAGALSETAISGESTKKIYVLLTKHSSVTARILRIFTWYEYTHTSIALERDGAHYSFNPVRGFTVERPIHKKRGATPCRLYCIEVTDGAYAEIESRIKWFVENPNEYKFNYVGLVLSILFIPIGIGNRYFCSQFVSDILTSSDATELRKRPARYFPRHFSREDSFTLTFNGEASTFTENPH